jgi:small-conductance mechanosensitive channel
MTLLPLKSEFPCILPFFFVIIICSLGKLCILTNMIEKKNSWHMCETRQKVSHLWREKTIFLSVFRLLMARPISLESAYDVISSSLALICFSFAFFFFLSLISELEHPKFYSILSIYFFFRFVS